MNDLFNLLERGTAILSRINAAELSSEALNSAKSELENLFSTEENIIPASSEGSEDQKEESSREALNLADTINKKADAFNDELQRIKKIRETLNLEAMDPLITVARQFIHRIYNFTSALE